MSLRPVTVIEKLFIQAAPHSLFGNVPVLYRNSGVQGPMQGKGHYRPLAPFSAEDSFLEKLAARICVQCFVICKKEGDRFPVSLFPSLSEFWCQSIMLIPELRSRERSRDWRKRR